MFERDPTRANWGWIGAKPQDLVDADYDALYAAVTGTGVDGGAFDPELVAGLALTGTATCTNAQAHLYGTSVACAGSQHLGVAVPALGFEDFGFRFWFRPSAHVGVRDVARFDNDEIIVQLDASNNWQVNDGTLRTGSAYGIGTGVAIELEDASPVELEDGEPLETEGTPVAAVDDVWYEVCLEREGNDLVLKVAGAPVLAWANEALDLAATDWRVGTDHANGCDGHFNDVRVYLKGRLAAHAVSGFPYVSRFRRTIPGVGTL